VNEEAQISFRPPLSESEITVKIQRGQVMLQNGSGLAGRLGEDGGEIGTEPLAASLGVRQGK
jgi:hypothetical protein